MDKLSEKLLDWSKLGKQHEADIKNCRSERVISHIRYAITPILANKKQHLTIQNETAIMRIDEPLMISAIINLLQNASRASGEGKEIALSIYNDENQNLIVCVRDQGIGIDENEIAKILEPFYMIDESRDRANEGSGLGLSLCDAIVRAHGGEMRFESKIGEGTEVMIIIPQDN